MEDENISQQFDEIEKRVKRLMEICKSLEVTNVELSNENNQIEEELLGKVKAEDNSEKERNLIRSKIEGLLTKLEDITPADP
ncbi:MAG: DUF904 domain-containing protein [Dehalococcoidales bacterium]|nr:DUF904 domain-containing protein [Dehalococcoidales bacterium]MDP7078228.1 DUF904 domain-containing protein [Desulfobacterales bacterium]MDP7355666.1 DUF904 domain-containing protein [Desulfobacterales bacterium]